MATLHGKNTVIMLNDVDISAFFNSTENDRTADSHDVTTFGATAKKYAGGLLDGKFSLEGFYDTTTNGPKSIIEPLLGTTVDFVLREEGTGTGLPEVTQSVVVTGYKESLPVADMVTVSVELQASGAP